MSKTEGLENPRLTAFGPPPINAKLQVRREVLDAVGPDGYVDCGDGGGTDKQRKRPLLPMVDACIRESQRLYPVAPFVVRHLTSDLRLKDGEEGLLQLSGQLECNRCTCVLYTGASVCLCACFPFLPLVLRVSQPYGSMRGVGWSEGMLEPGVRRRFKEFYRQPAVYGGPACAKIAPGGGLL